MSDAQKSGVMKFYDTHPINEDEILAKIAARGIASSALTELDLKDFDQDHYGGTEALDVLADLAGISSTHNVLDVCSGLGGPARWLAHQRGCRVTGLDFTDSRVEGAKRLTRRVGLDHLVNFVQGDATAMPLPSGQYDILIAQESWLHIANKAALISECVRVLRPRGVIAFTDIVVRSPLDASAEARLASEMHTAKIASAKSYAELLETNGCVVVSQDDLSDAWKQILVKRLQMYRSLRDTTIAKFGEARFHEYDRAYSHFVHCFVEDKLGGIRMIARKAGD
jgi:sarcosine/dimethylglycine N-methyltransferase